MKKFFLTVLILGDLVVIVVLVAVLYQRVTARHGFSSSVRPSIPIAKAVPGPAAGAAHLVATSTHPITAVARAPNPAPANPGEHRIRFSYRNARAKTVSISADFTGWKPEAMQKQGKNHWTFVASLTPGEYGYCFFVDGRSLTDPANSRKKRIGSVLVSAVVVKPAAALPAVPAAH
jgi:hypothetical protein